jgi:hypothetical protein
MNLPDHLFFTGVPGSHWSAIAQDIETIPGFNTTDHSAKREYSPGSYTGHKGAYFGEGMEFSAKIEYPNSNDIRSFIDAPWQPGTYGTKIVKSHEWAYKLPLIRHLFPNDWIMLVYRPDLSSYAWWHEAGGFNIKYPNYAAYKDSANMLTEIVKQNQAILNYGALNDVTWSHYTTPWLRRAFDCPNAVAKKQKDDILVAIVK